MVVYVIGHRNPDMDAIGSAIGYAWLLNNQSPAEEPYVAARVGVINAQTKFVLDRFEVEEPVLLNDVRPRVKDVAQALIHVTPTTRTGVAIQQLARTHHSLPVLNDDLHPVALINPAQMFQVIADTIATTSTLDSLLDKPISMVLDLHTGHMLTAADAVTDVLTEVMHSEADSFLVIDDHGNYVGVCRQQDLFKPMKHKVILVDHNEARQAVSGLDEADLLEVLDHHRLEPPSTTLPIRFQIEPVGCTATLITERRSYGLNFPSSIAGVLLSCILSDTLIFKSPTTTERDRQAALKLARWAGLVAVTANDEATIDAIHAYGAELLGAGAGLGSRTPEDIINKDLKFYVLNEQGVAIAQTEVTNLDELSSHREALNNALDELIAKKDLDAALLLVTNVVTGNSRIIVRGNSKLPAALPYKQLDDTLLDAPRVMSRKKQVLPALMAALN